MKLIIFSFCLNFFSVFQIYDHFKISAHPFLTRKKKNNLYFLLSIGYFNIIFCTLKQKSNNYMFLKRKSNDQNIHGPFPHPLWQPTTTLRHAHRIIIILCMFSLQQRGYDQATKLIRPLSDLNDGFRWVLILLETFGII